MRTKNWWKDEEAMHCYWGTEEDFYEEEEEDDDMPGTSATEAH